MVLSTVSHTFIHRICAKLRTCPRLPCGSEYHERSGNGTCFIIAHGNKSII